MYQLFKRLHVRCDMRKFIPYFTKYKYYFKRFYPCINWCWIKNKKLSEDFIREYRDCVDWQEISTKQTLSEAFMKEHRDYIHWSSISTRQKLSEDFIREHRDYIHWQSISGCQTLSEDFIREYRNA